MNKVVKPLVRTIGRRIAYILHLGLVEIRNLASPQNCEQVSDLADALELLPRFLEHAAEEDVQLIRHVLSNYRQKYPQSSFDYLAYLDGDEPPETF